MVVWTANLHPFIIYMCYCDNVTIVTEIVARRKRLSNELGYLKETMGLQLSYG